MTDLRSLDFLSGGIFIFLDFLDASKFLVRGLGFRFAFAFGFRLRRVQRNQNVRICANPDVRIFANPNVRLRL